MIGCPYVSYVSFMIKMEKKKVSVGKKKIFLKGRGMYE